MEGLFFSFFTALHGIILNSVLLTSAISEKTHGTCCQCSYLSCLSLIYWITFKSYLNYIVDTASCVLRGNHVLLITMWHSVLQNGTNALCITCRSMTNKSVDYAGPI